jgi:hypothetical protein
VTFLHPLALVGLAATAIPALLHLLERRAPPEADFPPLRYLSEAERQSARRLKLRHLLLLILRTVLIALVVLAAARPLIPSRGGGAGAAHQPTALVVILDNSPSSGVVVDGRPVLDRLKAVARASVAHAGSADRLWLMLADGVARAGSRDALLATIDSATVAPRRLDVTAAVAQAARLVDAEPLPAREVHVMSDLQRTALSVGGGEASVPRAVRVLALAPPGEATPNRGIAAARVTDGAVTITVAGTPGTGPAPVAVRLRDRDVGRALAEPGSGVTVPLPALVPGWWVGEVALDPDELRLDDRRAFAWRVAPPTAVRAEPSTGPFVAAALAVLEQGKRVGSGNEVVIGERTQAAPGRSVVLPPADPALVGQANRALAARGVHWRFGEPGTPGPIASSMLGSIAGIAVGRRYQIAPVNGGGGRGTTDGGDGADDTTTLASVNEQPWLVRDGDVLLVGSRLDTAWTALPASPGFVPFLDALVNRLARGEALVVEAEGAPGVQFHVRGTDTVGATVYGPDPRESDLTPASVDNVRRSLGAAVFEESRFARERFAGTHRADASGLLLALALLVAAVELGVATLTH